MRIAEKCSCGASFEIVVTLSALSARSQAEEAAQAVGQVEEWRAAHRACRAPEVPA